MHGFGLVGNRVCMWFSVMLWKVNEGGYLGNLGGYLIEV